jgi:hypothetical protein
MHLRTLLDPATVAFALALVAIALPSSARATGPSPAGGSKGGAAAKPQAAVPRDEARPLFEQGIAAVDAGKLKEAEGLFTRAFGLKRSWDIAANLGVVERKLGEHVLAAEHLSFALGALPPSESEKTRDGLVRELTLVVPHVARITVHCPLTGAEVRVGGKLRGLAPLDGPVFTAPGLVKVEVEKDGYQKASRDVAATAGGEDDVTLVPSPKPVERPRSWTAPAVAFGFGGAGLVVGVVAGALATARMSELRSECGPALVCPERLRASADEGRTAAHFSTAGFVTAAIGAAVGVTLVALPVRGAPAQVGILAGPLFVGVKGAF